MPSFVGREPELLRLTEAVDRGVGGQGALVLLSGEPGIGKTRLADRAVEVATARGAKVVWGRCWEAGGAPAYWPWIQVFRALGIDGDPFAVAESSPEARKARFDVFDLAVLRLREAAKQSPVAFVLDDLHAADVPSLHVLHLLARGLRGTKMIVLGTYREAEARLDSEVGSLLAKIAREGDVLPLGRLTEAEVASWVSGDATKAAAIHQITEGNPLFVEEILRLGGEVEPSRFPAGLRAVIDEHFGRVSPATRAVLEAGSVLGREFAASDLVTITGSSPDDVDARLREAAEAGVLSPTARGRCAFAHILLRDRLYDGLSPTRRAELHWKSGNAFSDRADLSAAAHHLLEGASAGDAVRAKEAALDAAERALERLALEDAVRLTDRAAVLSPGRELTRLDLELLIVGAEALLLGVDSTKGKAACVAAAAAAKTQGAGDLLARAALAYATDLVAGEVDDTMVALLRDALAALPSHDHPVRARAMARLAAALTPPRPADIPEIDSLANGAIAMARRLGDPDTLLYVLRFAVSAYGYRIPVAERDAIRDELVELARSLNQRLKLVGLLWFHITHLLEVGRRSEAETALDELARLSADLPQPRYQWQLPLLRAAFSCFDGKLEEAASLVDEATAIGERGGIPRVRLAWSLQRIGVAIARGDPASIAPDAPQILAVLERSPMMLPYTAWVHAATGQREVATEELRRVAERMQSFPWLIIAGEASALLEDADLARLFYEPLGADLFANRVFWGPGGAFAFGPTSRTLGDLARVMGRFDEALRHYDDAIAQCERIGAKPSLALSRRGREIAARKASTPSARPTAAAPSSAPPRLRREGDVWAVETPAGAIFRLKDSKGLSYLSLLLSQPGTEVHVLDLVGSEEAPSDAGPTLDARAKEQYRKRLEDLRDQVEEAEGFGDAARARRARDEIDALADQLAGAVGLGGRDRKAASNVERARINVQRRVKDAIDRIAEEDAGLGRYLFSVIKTGTYCSFQPI